MGYILHRSIHNCTQTKLRLRFVSCSVGLNGTTLLAGCTDDDDLLSNIMASKPTHLPLFLVVTTICGFGQSFSSLSINALTPKNPLCLSARARPSSSNWEDEFASSRDNREIKEYLPPWRAHESDTDQLFSGSEATPGKSQPFKAFGKADPQRNVLASPGGQKQMTQQPQQVARGGGGGAANTLLHRIKWPVQRDPPEVSPDFPLLLTRITITILSVLSTWYLHLFNGYSPVLASSAITLLVSTCLDRRLGQAAFCGSFAGMSGGHLAPNFGTAVLLGVLASINYEVLIHMKNFCLGIGGRLGATAFLATSVVAKYRRVGSVGRKLRRGIWKSGAGGLSSVMITMMVFHAIGAVATICLRESSDDSGAADPVRASSVIGLLGALFLKDPTSILALYGGSFVGMALPSRLMYGNAPGKAKQAQPQTPIGLLLSFAGAGALAGMIHGMTIHWGYWNGGWGGKAGLCAFAGCWLYRGFGNVYEIVRNGAK